jgi:dephospho-CoA kinase
MGRRIIGLTGGIATGKSTVSQYLASQHHLPVLDADVYARAAVAPGSVILQQLVQRYGPEILAPDGALNRTQLGEIIFQNLSEKQWVEQRIHPYVREQFAQATATYPPAQTLVYAIPLLFEAKLTPLVTEVWVVTCTPEQQLQRLIARNHLSREQAQARIDNQLPQGEKVKQANVVLDNSQTREALYQQIDQALAG